MQPYKFKVRYIPGPMNIADALSRLIKENVTEPTAKSSATEDYVKLVATESTPVAMTTREMELASEGDQELWTIWECLVNGQWHRIAYKEYFPMRNEVCAISKLVLRGTRIVVPTILREHVLELAHEGHPGIMYIHTDKGRQFTSQHFKDFMLENGITHHRTTPLWSQANGEEERQNRSIMKRVRIAQAEGRDWRSELDKFLIMYSTVHTIMGVSPSELLFGRKIRTKLPELTTMSMT